MKMIRLTEKRELFSMDSIERVFLGEDKKEVTIKFKDGSTRNIPDGQWIWEHFSQAAISNPYKKKEWAE